MLIIRALTGGIVALTLVTAPLLAMAGDFIAYEGKDSVQEGTGGAKKTVDGIDFWSDGAPPRPFKLLGYIDDTRHKSGLFGLARMAGLEGSIAKTARKNGGDAVILITSEAQTKGIATQSHETGNATVSSYGGNQATVNGSTSGNSWATRVENQHSRYAVVKYLVTEPSEPMAVNSSSMQ